MWVSETSKLTPLFCGLCILWTSKLRCLDWSFDKMNISHPISHYLIACPLIKLVIHCYSYLICPGKGAEIDCIDCKGLSPLLMASNCGAWKTVAFLLSIGKTFLWIFNTIFFLQYYLHALFCMFNIFSYWKKVPISKSKTRQVETSSTLSFFNQKGWKIFLRQSCRCENLPKRQVQFVKCRTLSFWKKAWRVQMTLCYGLLHNALFWTCVCSVYSYNDPLPPPE